jgi:outer membrane protein TolC
MDNWPKIVLLNFLLGLSGAIKAGEFPLNEHELKTLAHKGAPQLDQIEASFLMIDLENKQIKETFAPELFGQVSSSETNERPIIEFIPVWSPLQMAQLGVRQNLSYGLSAQAALGIDQRSATSPGSKYRDVTTTSVNFTVQIDLWKDLLGRMGQAKLLSHELSSRKAKIESDIQTKSFFISLRRIYWSIVATQESIKISEEMLKISEQQLSEARRRLSNSVAEADEVARNEAQVASKKASVLYYEYQKENYLKQLKILLPELTSAQVVLSPYDISQTVDEVLGCTALIAQETKIPYHFTHYDEIIQLIRQVKDQTVYLNSRLSDPDVKLYGSVKSTGVASEKEGDNYQGSVNDAIDDMSSRNRTGHEVGLLVTIPLGGAKSDTQKTKELYDEKRLMASLHATEAQVINTHQQLTKSIALLNEVVRAQKKSTLELKKRLKFMERKYQQARVSVNDLIQDQDALLRSSLVTVESQLQVLNVLFDYLIVFTETPCPFNRI